MSIIQMQRQADAAFRAGDHAEYDRWVSMISRTQKAGRAIERAGIERREGRARGFTIAKVGRVFGKR